MAIRTVVSLGLEGRMAEKYRSKLRDAERAGIRGGFWVALGEPFSRGFPLVTSGSSR